MAEDLKVSIQDKKCFEFQMVVNVGGACLPVKSDQIGQVPIDANIPFRSR